MINKNSCKLLCLIILISIPFTISAGFTEVFSWKQIEYEYGPGQTNGMDSGRITFPGATNAKNRVSSRGYANDLQQSNGSNDVEYIPYNNVPMGVTHHNGKLFITMPRRRPGIPSTLNYIDLSANVGNKSPKLRAYPNLAVNTLNKSFQSDPSRIISVYRTRVDACNRLWFVDTGMLEYPDNRLQVQQPSIWIIDLSTDKVINRFEIPANIVSNGNGLPGITLDVEEYDCDNAFAYLPDLVNRALYVYSLQANKIWAFNHNYFSYDPLAGDFNIGGQQFQWDDGIFSITLGNKNADGSKNAYFHAMASTNEFMVSTKVLKNETNSQRSNHGLDFKLVGNRGDLTQSTMHDFHKSTGVLFFNEISTNSIGCFNTKRQIAPLNHGTLHRDDKKMIYPSDLMIDTENDIWVMSNTMPVFIYSQLDTNQENFRVWKANAFEVIRNTVCA